MKQKLLHFFLIGLSLIVAINRANTQPNPLIYEPFDYALLNPLNWTEGGSGWQDAWNRAIGDDIIIREGNLDYGGWGAEAGNHLSIDVVNVGLRYDRRFPNIPDDGRALWASVLMDFRPGSSPNNVGNLTLTKNGSQAFSFGRLYGEEVFGLAWGGASRYTTDIPTDGLHWLVVKIQFSGDNSPEQAWLWVNPEPGTEPEPALADITVPQPGRPNLILNFGIDGTQVKAEGTPPLFMDMDELRIGDSFAEVSPFLVSANREVAFPGRLNVFPNPASEVVNLHLELPETMELSLQLLSREGKTLYQTEREAWPGGDNRRELSLKELHLPPGLYFVRIVGADLTISKKLVLY